MISVLLALIGGSGRSGKFCVNLLTTVFMGVFSMCACVMYGQEQPSEHDSPAVDDPSMTFAVGRSPPAHVHAPYRNARAAPFATTPVPQLQVGPFLRHLRLRTHLMLHGQSCLHVPP